ncbi:MAG: hypothetical protein COT90_02665 [Candidatus Diapherotrites archaeon CG10_big_fil_rev_8_21_14_0_10_31_34]|nr:MAG: hypothetical protein COT90_02665 [Candidatus Diapherotrites archaeon CG10_big_fil_rev_8_21_14_0_10_31_34]PJA17423.1 MAG: hypothetical protein COX63_02770 [Candidatus Diapherotrites archaeon CG_4_10_14_0_2_um_filter_31_5]
MISEIAYAVFLSKPSIFWLGIITYTAFVFAALISVLNARGKRIFPFKWHSRMAYIALALAILHGILGLSVYFNF